MKNVLAFLCLFVSSFSLATTPNPQETIDGYQAVGQCIEIMPEGHPVSESLQEQVPQQPHQYQMAIAEGKELVQGAFGDGDYEFIVEALAYCTKLYGEV
ncbi:hypothetical protein L4D76_00700 [Photobacterium sagamiensis]|uniref:hypothetical protein n=1 Tax=Photobacterium sagamiensis TaxID=2910241 RepID=UPI003D0A2E70